MLGGVAQPLRVHTVTREAGHATHVVQRDDPAVRAEAHGQTGGAAVGGRGLGDEADPLSHCRLPSMPAGTAAARTATAPTARAPRPSTARHPGTLRTPGLSP